LQKHACKLSGINTSKSLHLKPFRMNTYKKRGGGPAHTPATQTRNPSNELHPERPLGVRHLSVPLPAIIAPAKDVEHAKPKKGRQISPAREHRFVTSLHHYVITSALHMSRPCLFSSATRISIFPRPLRHAPPAISLAFGLLTTAPEAGQAIRITNQYIQRIILTS
jgi:hypothetical protein